MFKSDQKSENSWTKEEISLLRDLIKKNTPICIMEAKLGKTEDAIYSKASDIGISLKPLN